MKKVFDEWGNFVGEISTGSGELGVVLLVGAIVVFGLFFAGALITAVVGIVVVLMYFLYIIGRLRGFRGNKILKLAFIGWLLATVVSFVLAKTMIESSYTFMWIWLLCIMAIVTFVIGLVLPKVDDDSIRSTPILRNLFKIKEDVPYVKTSKQVNRFAGILVSMIFLFVVILIAMILNFSDQQQQIDYVRQNQSYNWPGTVQTEVHQNNRVVCNGTPRSRLVIGVNAQIVHIDGSSTRLRSSAGLQGSILENMAEGTRVEVIGGPTCADGYTWWQLRLSSGLTGWTAEGSSSVYFIEPLS